MERAWINNTHISAILGEQINSDCPDSHAKIIGDKYRRRIDDRHSNLGLKCCLWHSEYWPPIFAHFRVFSQVITTQVELEVSKDHWFDMCTYISYCRVSELLKNSNHHSSNLLKFGSRQQQNCRSWKTWVKVCLLPKPWD